MIPERRPQTAGLFTLVVLLQLQTKKMQKQQQKERSNAEKLEVAAAIARDGKTASANALTRHDSSAATRVASEPIGVNSTVSMLCLASSHQPSYFS